MVRSSKLRSLALSGVILLVGVALGMLLVEASGCKNTSSQSAEATKNTHQEPSQSDARTGGAGAAAGESSGEVLYVEERNGQYLVMVEVQEGSSMETGSYALVVLDPMQSSASQRMALPKPGDQLRWFHILAPGTVGYVSGWNYRVIARETLPTS